ncbi:hypothetical protein RB653_003904 [Dictyostelium firmibasis]|uniref:acylaminoacyl-peptidase n=1 Tax=Dictyostelium firmibasis TaxID=79012 RepID=A0AAN7YXI6_9MYCE
MENLSEQEIKYRDDTIKVYKELLSIPTVSNVFFTNNQYDENKNQISASVIVSQIDITNKKSKFYMSQKTIINDSSSKKSVVVSSPIQQELATSIISVSPSHKKVLTIKENPSTEFEFSFDITDGSHLITSITSKDIHKKILNDEWFGSFSWSPCEKFIAFIADSKLNVTGFFDKEPKDKAVGEQFIFRDDWGETYSPVANPSIFIVDIEKEVVFPVEPFPSDKISAGQVIWTPNGEGLVYVGWNFGNRKLGIRACFNRSSSLYLLNFKEFMDARNQWKENQKSLVDPKQPNKLTTPLSITNLIPNGNNGCYRSPRFTPDSLKLIFLGFNERIYPHNTCSKIFSLNWPSNDSIQQQPPQSFETLLDYKNYNDSFPGIFCQSLPERPFIDEKTLLFPTPVRSVQKIVTFNIESKELKEVKISSADEEPKLYSLYDIDFESKKYLIGESSVNQPSKIYLVDYLNNSSTGDEKVLIYSPKPSDQCKSIFSSFGATIHTVPVSKPTPPPFTESIKSFELIYLKNKNSTQSSPLGCLVFIHGGPHSNLDVGYASTITYLVSLGYNIIIPNYRGSTGFGKDFNDCLPGYIGDLDVDDCLQSINYTLENIDNTIDKNNIGVIGGSHGGFLSAHLSRFPIVKTSIMRNPVIDIPSMSTLSDIPDWCFFEAGVNIPDPSSQYHTLPSIEEIEKMRKCSPSFHIEKVKIPSLLALGDSDLRVPPSQGLLYYRMLRERDVPTKCLMYPKTGHGLDSIDARLDQWINISLWLKKYLN